jgi:hypothetical protein
MPERHFPPTWVVEDNGACFVARDGNGQPLAYVYYDHPQASDLTWDEARRIAANVAKLPEVATRARAVAGQKNGPDDRENIGTKDHEGGA